MRGLSASTGHSHPDDKDQQPFISGNFEYGMGRPAAKRKVHMPYPSVFLPQAHSFQIMWVPPTNWVSVALMYGVCPVGISLLKQGAKSGGADRCQRAIPGCLQD